MSRTTLVLVLAAAFAAAPGADPENPASTIKKLRQERLSVLEELNKVVETMVRMGSGKVGYGEAHEVKVALLNARLELAETNADRIKVHEQFVAEAENWLKITISWQKVGAGEGSAIDVLKAKAHLLEMQIGLEQAKTAQ